MTFLQVAVPSRTDVKEYQELKSEIDQLVGHINGRFSTPAWSPIRYIFGSVNQQDLAAYYRDADVALITPLRDGMNLVAKEFVACQSDENPGKFYAHCSKLAKYVPKNGTFRCVSVIALCRGRRPNARGHFG